MRVDYDVFALLCALLCALSMRIAESARQCSDNEVYDNDKDVCLHRCGKDICTADRFCSDRRASLNYDPPVCLIFCPESCSEGQYCNKYRQECLPCGDICGEGGGIFDQACRAYCYETYKEMLEEMQVTQATVTGKQCPAVMPSDSAKIEEANCTIYLALVAVFALVAVVAIIVGIVCYCRLRGARKEKKKHAKHPGNFINQYQTGREQPEGNGEDVPMNENNA